MAPPTVPTGPRAANKSSQRGSNRGTRGGITKNRGPTRTDRDGDVSMDAPAAGGASARGRGGRGQSSRASSQQSSRVARNVKNYLESGAKPGSKAHFNRITLKVHGLKDSKAAGNADGGRRSLLDFLARKANKDKKIVIGKNVMVGDIVWISVSKDDAPDILRLNGYTYAGAPLSIVETDEKMPTRDEDSISPEAAEIKKKLGTVLANRYNPEQKLLDLSALGADEILKSIGTFDSQNVAEKSFKALLHIASTQYKSSDEKKEALQAVSIARNDINDVGQVYSLAYSLPDLKRLDLSGNKLDTLSKLSKWNMKFKHLEELHLAGNPVTAVPNYAAEILQWFPSLQNLNGEQVRTPQEAAEALKALQPQPLPIYPSNLRDGENNVAYTFLSAFFPLFDSDRARLASEFYDDDSWFSLAAAPNDSRPLPWKSYMKFSRNVQKLGSRNTSTLQRLFTGGNLIADMWKALPATRHPAIDQLGQWLIDCHTFSHLADPSGQGFAMGLIINVNGQFEEADPSVNQYGTRTFSRTFILGPSKPNPPPKHPYRVISDQLTLHNWVATASPPISAVSAGPVTNTIPAVVGPNVPDEATKAQLIQEVSRLTGMTAEYSELCLVGTANWNLELALKSFEDQRANLPATAFLANV